MANAAYFDRVLETTVTTGTGTLTLAGAVTGYRSFGAVGDGNTTPMAVWEVDANGVPSGAWETALVCTYTAAGTTLSRGTFQASSTGSVINFGAGTKVVAQALPAAILNGLVTDSLTHITGLLITKNDATHIDVSAGTAYDPSSQKIITYAGATAIAAGTLNSVSNQWNQVYLYDNAGTPSLEIVNNADPPATTYAGTARQGGTNSNRRWIGAFLSNANGGGSVIVAQNVIQTAKNQLAVRYLVDVTGAPFRVLAGGSSLVWAQVSLVGCVPRYAASEILSGLLFVYGTTATATLRVNIGIDGTNNIGQSEAYLAQVNISATSLVWAPIEVSTPSIYYILVVIAPGVGPGFYIDVGAYKMAR